MFGSLLPLKTAHDYYKHLTNRFDKSTVQPLQEENTKDVAMQSHKWLRAHEKPSMESVGSAASAATRRANAEQLELSQKQQKSKKNLPEVVGRQDMARKAQAESRKQV